MEFNKMNAVQIEMLKILECFIHGKTYTVSEGFSQYEELHKLAVMHKVSSVVYECIRKSADVDQENEFLQLWKKRTIREVSVQMQKTNEFLKIYRRLCEGGVCPLVVKGIIRREMYPLPDYCCSADEDLLIRKGEFGKCDEILLKAGFKRQEIDWKTFPMEVSYFHPTTMVYLEVHTQLFREKAGRLGDLNQEFKKAFDTGIIEEINGVPVWTLNPTLHIWYLVCHSLKHFLHGGFGVRQVCDIVKMSEYYEGQIDWKWVYERMQELQVGEYWGGLVDIGVKWLGFVPGEEIPYERVDGKELLLDLFESGIYGSSSVARKQSSNMTVAAMKHGKTNIFVSLMASLFPSKEYMCKKFSYVKKHSWLFPVAYVQRFVYYLKAKKKHDSRKSISIGKKRIELLKKYKLVQK